MRVLLDSCVPQRLRHALVGHDVESATFAGLEGCSDRELLDSIEGRFDVLVTCDQGIPWQQDLRGRRIAIVVLAASTNRFADLLPLVPAALLALAAIAPGEVCEISS